MGFRVKFCFLVLALLFAASGISWGQVQDPELEQCKHQCQVQQQFDERKRSQCVRSCEEYSKEKQRRQHGGGGGRQEGEEYGWEKGRHGVGERDPQKEYQQCRTQCRRESEGGRHQERCFSRCEEERRRREQEHGRRGERGEGWYVSREREEEEQGGRQQQEERNPYVFEDQHFVTGIQTQHGRVRILQKFTQRSKLLRGIENYRIAISESEPQTFTVPSHWDTDAVFFVARGKGTVSLMQQDRRESFNIRQGDLVRIRAGTTAYLVNRDNNERLVLAKLLRPVNTPGEFEAFFGAGGENPRSFYKTFSDEILEAAFNTRKDKVQRIFGEQRQGVIIKASEEQIRALNRHEEGGIWPFGGGESKDTINLFQQRPTYSNQYGQLYEIDSSHFRQLRDLDLAVSLANITQGAMIGPTYNSKATKISVVVDGNGYFEMACPHLSQQQEQRTERQQQGSQGQTTTGGTSYQRVSSRLSPGTVFVVPAGHPYVAVASGNQNLQLLCFEVNAYNNEKFLLAGRRNVINQLDKEAKELSFGIPAREVEEFFNSQKEEFFFPGPRQQRQGQRGKGWSEE